MKRLAERTGLPAIAKRALITGITGQDGSYLAEHLLAEGYQVFGVVRRSSTETFERIDHLRDRLTLLQADLLDQMSVIRALQKAEPVEVYNLAAQSFVPTSFEQPVLTGQYTALGVTRMLEGGPQRRQEDPLLPGLLERDVRQGPRRPADGADPLPPAQPLRGGEGLRALHDGELPRELRALRLLGDPLQPRVAAPRARVRHPQDHRRRRAHQARPAARAAARQPRGAPRLGLRRRLRRDDAPHAAAGRRRRTT